MNTITPLFEVAIEWETVTVGQVCQVNPGKPKSDALPADAPVSFVPMAAVDEVAGAITQSEDRAFSKVRSSYTAFRDGDVIFAKITPCMENGKAAIAGGLTNGLGFGSSEFHVLRPSEKVLPEFVYQLLRQKSFRAEAKDNMTGSVGQARVPTEWLKSFEFTLPSIEEQREIVRLVAQLQAQMESTSDRLSTIPTLLKKFRQSILATACSGQLTADWRNERGIDSAPDLKGLTKAKGKKALEQPVELELPDLPDSYAAVSVGEIVQLIQYGTSSKSGIQSPGSVPVLRMGNIQNGTLDLKELKYAKPDKEILGLLLEPGDILFNRTNSPDLVGKTAVFREPSQMTFASYLIRLRVAPGLAVPEFVSYWFNSSWGKEWAHLAKTDGVSQSNINGTKLSVMPIPLPHFAEQEEIVRRVESLFALADSIESRLAEASAQVERTTQAILVEELPPIKRAEFDNLGSVVIIAGANGSGKTRLKQAIIDTVRNPNGAQLNLSFEATRPVEVEAWGDSVDVRRGESNPAFAQYMGSRTRGGTYTGTVVQIDSQRSINNVNFQPLNLSTPDPDDQDVDFFVYLNPFTNRWNDTVNKIFQKVANRDHKIAQFVKTHPRGTNKQALEDHPDPFLPFQTLFTSLLPGKRLEEIDPKNPREFNYSDESGQVLGFSTLSSGEQEVIKIAFDLQQKRMTHCVFLIDEPELHLHPTLTFRLIETLKNIGESTNQFIFFTHSGDLISTYYASGNVFFLDSTGTTDNQAHRLSDVSKEHSAIARAMGDNLGLFAVGKKLIFVEGQEASRDRLTYHSICQKVFPEAYVIPAGFADGIGAMDRFGMELQKAVFGIDFFMIRDRDGLTDDLVAKLEASGRIRCLKRRHIENYLLDEEVMALVAERFSVQDMELRKATGSRRALDSTASGLLNQALLLNMKEHVRVRRSMEVPTVKDAQSLTLDQLEAAFLGDAKAKREGLEALVSQVELESAFAASRAELEQALRDGSWVNHFPGKLVFERFCTTHLKTEAARVREAYVQIALDEKPEVLEDIIAILKGFQAL